MALYVYTYLRNHRGVAQTTPFSHRLIRSLNIYVEMILPESYFLNHISTFRSLVTVQYLLLGN